MAAVDAGDPLGRPSSTSRASLEPQQPPHSARPQSVRGQSRRYLQQTLTKLSEDSLRIGRRLQGEAAWAPSPLPPLRQVSGGRSPDRLRDTWELHQLAADLPSKQAMDLSEPLASGEEVLGREGEWDAGLLDEGSPSMPMALLAVAKVINAWEAEVRATADIWRVGLNQQAQQKVQAEERWSKLHKRLDLLQDRLEQVDVNVQGHRAWTEQLQATLQGSLEASLVKVAEAQHEHVQRATDSLEVTVTSQGKAIKEHVDLLLAGTLEKADGGQRSVGQQIKWMSDQMGNLSQSEDFLRVTAEKWQRNAEEAASEVRRAQSESHEAREESRRLDASIAELTSRLQKAEQALEKAQHAPAKDMWRRLKELEERGNVRIDRQTGRLDFARPLEFAHCTPAEDPSHVEFSDASAAAVALADVAEVSALFKVPVQVEVQLLPGKGGKPDFWEHVACAQASFVGQQLGKSGVPQQLITNKGSLVPKGTKVGFVTLHLHQELFPSLVSGRSSPKSAARMSKSPARR